MAYTQTAMHREPTVPETRKDVLIFGLSFVDRKSVV